MDRLVRATAVSIVLFFVVLGLVIGSRMDQTTIALLGGTTIGLLIAAPCAAIVTYLVMRNRDESSAPKPPPTPTYYIVPQNGMPMPPALPPSQPMLTANPPAYQQIPAPFVLPPQRKFYLIGGDGTAEEVSPDADSAEAGSHPP